jgi:signal transduction histidine kinase
LSCLFVSVPVGYLFFRSMFPGEFSRRLYYAIVALFGFFVLLALLAPLPLLLDWNPLYYVCCLVLIGYCLLRLAAARRRRREGAGYFLVGFAILGLISANDMLYDLQLISSVYLIPVGMFFFIIAQGFALSLGFSRSFAAVELLSGQLERRNLALKEEMDEHARLEREIVRISEDERRSLGHALHDGLCQQLTAARLRCSVLQRSGTAGSHELKQLSKLLDDSVEQAYELSRGLWPAENEARAMRDFLEDHCRRLAAASGVTIRVWHGSACEVCSHPNSIQLCRIAQEAIGNALRHAKARTIEVKLGCASPAGQLTLSVRDDGVGRQCAAPSSGGLGLRIMAHRARSIGATLHIADAEAGGTVVRCQIPCALGEQNCVAGAC